MKEGGVFCFAGLWEHWTVPPGLSLTGSRAELDEGEALEICTILAIRAALNL